MSPCISCAPAGTQGRWKGAAHIPGSASSMEHELICAKLKRLFLSPHIASEVVSFVFKAVHHFCHVWRDPASATQQAQRMSLPGLAVM